MVGASKDRSITEMFQYILDHYHEVGDVVDSSTEVYQVLCRDLPSAIKGFLKDDKYIVNASMGIARTAECPWIAIMDKNITLSTQKGLYVAYLFKKDLSGFYLTLNQGMKNYEDLFGNKKYENAKKVAGYFVSQIHDVSFVAEPIDLGAKRGSRGYGYAQGNVIQKHYTSGRFNDRILLSNLFEIMDVYKQITMHMDTASYDNVIKGVLADEDIHLTDVDNAIDVIKKAVDPEEEIPYGFFRKLQEVRPKADRSDKFKKITQPRFGKIDYIKKAKRDAESGLLGEELVLQYEKERLASIGLDEYADKIKWVSQESDRYGYDIISYDSDLNGGVREIKIEVKTTTSKVDTDFFVSRNEVEKSNEVGKDYCVYRVYDVRSQSPKFYRAFGPIENNFILDPVTYMARYKYPNVDYFN